METRNVLTSPFAADSIWNMPIGSNAEYLDAQITETKYASADVDYFYILDGNDPLQPLYAPGNWGVGRSSGTEYQQISLPLPHDLIVPDATETQTPNNAAAFLLPDGRTLVQVSALTRDRPGGFVYGWLASIEDIYGAGITGGHGGSGLSSIGGTIRLGELTSSEPITHALKINLQASHYISYSEGVGGGLGYRWPAVKADSYANHHTYGGSIPELMMGSLLAIPPQVTPESLGLETEAGIKLFYAFQDYGAYVADDTATEAHAIAVENGVSEEFSDHYGYEFDTTSGAFYNDYMKLFAELHIVTNNSPEQIGGGGTPRAPLALELDDSATFSSQEEEQSTAFASNNNPLIANSLPPQNHNQYLEGEDTPDYLGAGVGNDTLIGGYSDDILVGSAGNDYLDGGGGNDTLDGGDGRDYLSGGFEDDSLDGGRGYDTLVESDDVNFLLTNSHLRGKGIDTIQNIERVILSGGDRNNVLDAAAFSVGTVKLLGGKGNDTLRGGERNDSLFGGAGRDRLYGNQGRDYLYGGDGNDKLYGGQGGDKLRGEEGKDLLLGVDVSQVMAGQGEIDLLVGGSGADVFIIGDQTQTYYNDGQDNTLGLEDYALIRDFRPEESDTIELHGSASDYLIEDAPIGLPKGTAIFLNTDSHKELIAIVQHVDNLELQNPYMVYYY